MKFSKGTIYSFLLFIIFANSCGSSTPPPTNPGGIPTESYTPPSGLYELERPEPLSFPDIYFLIDESGSMMDKDSTGESCDPDNLRYKIPLFIASVIKSLNDQSVAKPPNIHIFLSHEQQYIQNREPFLPANAVDTLNNFVNNPNSSFIQPFDASRSPDALEFILSNAKENDYIFLLTDGDFRKTRYANDAYDQNASDTAEKVKILFENKTENINTIVFMLCMRRIQSESNRFIKQTWENISDNNQAVVYGYDLDDFSNMDNVSIILSDMLSVLLNNWEINNKNGYLNSGWGWYDGKDLEPTDNLNPGLVRLRYDAVTFDNFQANSKLQPVARINQNPVPELDKIWSDQIDDFISPEKKCGPQLLDFDKNSLNNYTFYWWWADIPEITARSPNRIVLQNDTLYDYFFDVQARSSLVKTEFLKSADLDMYLTCFEEFWINIGGKNFPLEYGEGKLYLRNVSNPFNDEEQPLPYSNGIVPIQIHGAWSIYDDNQFTSRLLLESEAHAKIRYKPVYVAQTPPSTAPPTFSLSQEMKIIVPLKYFEHKYYPKDIFGDHSWQPSVSFEGGSCPSGLTTAISPPYPEVGGPFANFDVKTIKAQSTGLEIKLRMNEDDEMECEKLILDWNKWPSGIDWETPGIINLDCNC